jgi:hypothetical protein
MREKDSKCVLFVYFLCICAPKRCMCNRYRQDDKKMRKKKVKWKEKAPADLYKVSGSLFSNCYFVHDCYVSNLFPCSSGDSFSSLPIQAAILVDQDRKAYMLLWQSIYIYIYILSLFLFFGLYI